MKNTAFNKEMLRVLVIKVMVLYLIGSFFFSHSRKDQIDTQQISHHLGLVQDGSHDR